MTYDTNEELFDSPSKLIYLTRNEVLYIDDSLTMMLDNSQGGEGIFSTMRPLVSTASLPAPVDLIEKIAIGVLFTLDPLNQGKEVEIALNDGDLFCLRELAQSYIKIGEEQVGYSLKYKIYQALFCTEYNLGKQMDDVLEGFTPASTI